MAEPTIWERLGRAKAQELWPAAAQLRDDAEAERVLREHFADHLACARWVVPVSEGLQVAPVKLAAWQEDIEREALRLLLQGLRAGLAEIASLQVAARGMADDTPTDGKINRLPHTGEAAVHREP